MKKCFGIVSWFPDKEPARTQRQERIDRLFKQLNTLWPDVDILVITQNWKTFTPKKIKNKIVRVDFEQGLGILGARKELRKAFLKTDYDYIIMFDDDAIIKYDNLEVTKKFMTEVDKHPKGFCFIHGRNSKYNPYMSAQLNLCAISKFIYEQEDMVDVDPQKNQGYEDSIFATLLHHKYSDYEFTPPTGIKCIQFGNKKEVAPSTWSGSKDRNWLLLNKRHHEIEEFIFNRKELPNLQLYYKYDILVSKSAPEWLIKNKIRQKENLKAQQSMYISL